MNYLKYYITNYLSLSVKGSVRKLLRAGDDAIVFKRNFRDVSSVFKAHFTCRVNELSSLKNEQNDSIPNRIAIHKLARVAHGEICLLPTV